MKMAAAVLMIALVVACTQATQDSARSDGQSVDWRAAEGYAQAASTSDAQGVMSLIDGSAGSADAPWGCASCHGDDGQGSQNIPRLAGVSAGYLVKQLHDYRGGVRLNDNMQFVVASLTEEEMAALGAYYASLQARPSSEPSLGGDLEQGRSLALAGNWSVNQPSCFSCHGPLGWGVEDIFPAIAGQHPAYTHAQLAAWKTGRRANSPLGLMHSVARSLSDVDMRAVSDYLATLPPPQSRNPRP